jgi:hypothetical protein
MLITVLMFAQITAPAATPVQAKDQTPTAKVECRMVQEAGSRIPTKVCRLDKEWELLSKDAQDDMRSSRNSRSKPNN